MVHFNALHKTIGLESLTKHITESGLEPIPEDPEAEEQAEIELQEEIINLDNRDDNVIQNQDDLVNELYGKVDVTNPDDSIFITEEKDLTPAQMASKKRHDQIANEVSKSQHHFEIHDEGWSFEKYLELVEQVCEERVTEVGEPTSQANFRKRYKKDWDPDMTHVVDFDIPRSKTRNTYKPRGWEERVELENKLLCKLGKIKTEPLEDDDFNQDEEAGPSNHVVKKTNRIFTDENDDDRSDSLFDSDDDFEKPKQIKRKFETKDDLPPPKKSKLKENNVKIPKPKSKPKGLSISRQIVR